MARLARSQLPDGLLHVTTRGNRRQPIVITDADARKLMTLVDEERLCIRAYCLMPNHLHLVVDEQVATLARAMSRINGRYAQWFNRKYGLSGHLFQGRFKAKPIEDEAHLHGSIVYVLMNPVEAGLCRPPVRVAVVQLPRGRPRPAAARGDRRSRS